MRALVAVALALGSTAALAVTITDCESDPRIVVNLGTDSTTLDVGADDLVLACPLQPKAGTSRVRVAGRDVTIQGPQGRVVATGTTSALVVAATGTLTISEASLESRNGNGDAVLTAAGDVTLTGSSVSVGTSKTSGDGLTITCTGTSPPCRITATGTSLKSRLLDVTAVGDVTFGDSNLTTSSPRDHIAITSATGSAYLGGACSANRLATGNEGELRVTAAGDVDLSASTALVAEEIIVRAGVGSGDGDVDLRGVTLRNDFGKKGQIVVEADEGKGAIDIGDAVLVDDDEGGSDVSELNGREAVPHTGFEGVVGTPELDG